MNLLETVKLVQNELVEYQIKCLLNDIEVDLDTDFIEPTIVFLSAQSNSVPIGALLGAIVNNKPYLLGKGLCFIEALVEHDIIDIEQINGNWVIHPIVVEHTVNKLLGCDTRPIKKEARTVFCGKTLHKPVGYRVDHLEYMNSIKFVINDDFLEAFDTIPDNAPYQKTLPDIINNHTGTLYVDHKYDGRGRTYCAGHVNYQSTEWEKCLLKFHKDIKITDEGRNNLALHKAGLKPENIYLAKIVQLIEESESTGMFIGADARASGIQLLSILSGCETSAIHVGLLDKSNEPYALAGERADLVVNVAKGETSRSIFKECCMHHFYGGTKTPKLRLGEENLEGFYETLEELFPGCEELKNDIQNCYWNTEVFTAVFPDGFMMQQPVIGIMVLELDFPNDPEVTFGYRYKYLQGKRKGLELAANLVHAVDGYVARELIYRAAKGSYGQINELALVRAIKQADASIKPNDTFCLYKLHNTPISKWVLLGRNFLEKAYAYFKAAETMPSFTVISIHDDFKCHPNYVHWMKFLYIEILAEIANSDLTKDLLEQINPKKNIPYEPTPALAVKLRQAFKDGTGIGLE